MSWIIEVERQNDPNTGESYWTFVLKRLLKGINNTAVYEVARSLSRSKTRDQAVWLGVQERDRHDKRSDI